MFLITLTLKSCVRWVKHLPVILRYISDQYKSQEMCDKAILENGGTLTSVPDCNKNFKKRVIKLLIIL